MLRLFIYAITIYSLIFGVFALGVEIGKSHGDNKINVVKILLNNVPYTIFGVWGLILIIKGVV